MGRASRDYWTVVATKTLSGRKAEAEINKQNFETYQPVYRAPPVRGVRKTLPLFPGYIFVKINHDNWKSVHYTRDVKSVLMVGEHPARIHDHEIEQLRSLENEKGYIEPSFASAPVFAIGETVEARRGVFRDKFGTFAGFVGTSRDRVRVLFSVLGKKYPHVLSPFDIAKAAA